MPFPEDEVCVRRNVGLRTPQRELPRLPDGLGGQGQRNQRKRGDFGGVSRQDTLNIVLIPGGDSLLQRRRQLPDRHRREEPVRQRPLPAAGPQEQSVQERELEHSGALAGVRLG